MKGGRISPEWKAGPAVLPSEADRCAAHQETQPRVSLGILAEAILPPPPPAHTSPVSPTVSSHLPGLVTTAASMASLSPHLIINVNLHPGCRGFNGICSLLSHLLLDKMDMTGMGIVPCRQCSACAASDRRSLAPENSWPMQIVPPPPPPVFALSPPKASDAHRASAPFLLLFSCRAPRGRRGRWASVAIQGLRDHQVNRDFLGWLERKAQRWVCVNAFVCKGFGTSRAACS